MPEDINEPSGNRYNKRVHHTTENQFDEGKYFTVLHLAALFFYQILAIKWKMTYPMPPMTARKSGNSTQQIITSMRVNALRFFIWLLFSLEVSYHCAPHLPFYISRCGSQVKKRQLFVFCFGC